jgi:hypothetical protein
MVVKLILTMKRLSDLTTGARVIRFFHVAEKMPPMPLFVIHMDGEFVYCSISPDVDYRDMHSPMPMWLFSKSTGQEYDPEIAAMLGARADYSISHIEPA